MVPHSDSVFKGFNDIPEQKLSDGELLDDVPVSFQMN